MKKLIAIIGFLAGVLMALNLTAITIVIGILFITIFGIMFADALNTRKK
jgi:hypothetical protein